MARETHPQTNFTGGEWSPRADARIDISKYNNSADIIENFLINQVGGAMFRPGTTFVNTAFNSAAGPIFLMNFQYNTSQCYVMEAGNQYFRFYANGGILVNGSTPVQLATPYFISDVATLRSAQNADTKYIVSTLGTYQPQKLVRATSTSFSLNPVKLIGGPFLDTNISLTTITPSSDTAATTLTATISAWAANTYYSQGALVTNGGNTYICIQPNFSGSLINAALTAPGTVVNDNSNGGTLPWTTTSQSIQNTTFATATTEYIKLTNFGFAIPAGATINGVTVTVLRQCNLSDPHTPSTTDSSVKIVLAGSPVGTDMSLGAGWITPPGGGQTTTVFGSSTNLWGESIAPADVNNVGFGVAIAASMKAGGTASILSISINVTYTTGSFATDLANNLWQLGAMFYPAHVGSLWAVKSGTVLITGYTDPTHVTGYVQPNPDGSAGNLATGPGATTVWAEGSFSNYRGWPTACVFYEQRLYYAKGDSFYGSTIGAFDDFSAGTELDTDAVDYELLEDLVNSIGWLAGSNFAMKAGTSDGSFTISSGTQNLPISASNILAQRQTIYASSDLYPARIGSAIYYASRDYNQIRELQYYIDIEADRSIDMTLMSDHILFDGGGAIQIDHQQYPNDRIWVPRLDGQAAILTRNIEQEVQGWSRFIMGVSSGSPGVIESLTIIPLPGGTDQIWVSVLRYINGVATRCIEYFTPENFSNPWEPVRMDCSLTLNNPITITGATQATAAANGCMITAPAHGFVNLQQVKIDNVKGMTQLNGNFYKIANVTFNTFTLTDLKGNAIDSSGFNIYLSSGEVRAMVTEITGLSYLNGEQVVVSCDGGVPAKQQLFTVISGSITLPQPAAVVNVGLPYTGKIRLQKFSGTATGKMTRVYLATLRVVNSLGLKVGTDLNKLAGYKFANVNDPLGHPPALFTGDLEISYGATWSKTDQVYIIQDQPLPLFICGAFFRSESGELD